jgi:hypothetical protein
MDVWAKIFFWEGFIAKKVCTAWSRTSYNIIPLTNLNKYTVHINYRSILQNHIHKYWTEINDVTTIWKRNVCSFITDHDVQIAVGTRVESPQNCYIAQIPGHTNYSRSVRQQFFSNTGLLFSREMTVSTIGPFQIWRSLCVIDTNFTILRHFLLKLWRNGILR